MDFFEDEPQPQRYGRQRGAGDSLLARRAGAVGAGLLVFLLLVLGIRGCLDNRKDRMIKNYVSDSAELVNESAAIGNDFFALLGKPGNATPLELKARINSFRASSDQLAERANKLDAPDEVRGAERWLITALELRRDALAEIARLLPRALSGASRSRTSDRIAGQMQAFLASDVIYLQRFVPEITAELADRDLDGDVQVPQKRFLNDVTWLLPGDVKERLGEIRGSKTATPGLHGMGLTKVTVDPGGVELGEDQASDLKATSKLTFDVEVQNQGDSEETDVPVTVKVDDIELEKTVGRIGAGETKTLSIPLSDRAPTGPTSVAVKVGPVAGEKLTDNNKASYPVVFQR